ncbi:hypothetical protein BBK36DRAFT_1176845 [Trichoderma citrinoviride]|uniref:Uncharacterized protein n=1 Tax=Trichoderma citrinoviride TaxID=58853 RepID=A0A2T4B5P9_9HYPO|nr:hypothetical protein BBK36DRAFT_1176845 [Trichoderma citrinoviride]PTB64620.1 hypothetical protein BBK36DRAFT_1176845 [Trichoderma citrinoviride]
MPEDGLKPDSMSSGCCQQLLRTLEPPGSRMDDWDGDQAPGYPPTDDARRRAAQLEMRHGQRLGGFARALGSNQRVVSSMCLLSSPGSSEVQVGFRGFMGSIVESTSTSDLGTGTDTGTGTGTGTESPYRLHFGSVGFHGVSNTLDLTNGG